MTSARAPGLLSQRDLHESQIRRALADGTLEEPLPGLYVDGSAPRSWVAALRRGWRPTCMTAATLHGLWIPSTIPVRLHAYRPRVSRSAAEDPVIGHGWCRSWPETSSIASVPQLLRHAARCLTPEETVILVDSAFHRKRLTSEGWQEVLDDCPAKLRRLLSRAGRRAESGSESRVRFFLDSHRIPYVAQAEIPGVGRVDFLVCGRWIIECDSRAHHGDDDAQKRDRRRDMAAQRLGYLVTRLSFQQIWQTWPETREFLLMMHHRVRRRRTHSDRSVRREDHLSR